MTAELVVLLLASVAIVPLSWALPDRIAMDGVATVTALVIALLSPIAFLWLLIVTAIGWVASLRLDANGSKSFDLGVVTLTITGAFLILRELDGVALIGGAYFTLRALHVIFDVWMKRLQPPSLRQFCHYLFFLPGMAIGPINRFQSFQRSIERRRFDPQSLADGAERVLLGLAQATILGGLLMPRVTAKLGHMIPNGFLDNWLHSACGWITLYFVFAGFSSVAIGIAAMCGLKMEENFRAPYRATSLIDFWTRWHITLSFWCRDYVFQPVSAILRNPLIGLFAAMAVIGLWHETSLYYVLWAVWQTLGIALNRIGLTLWQKYNITPLPAPLKAVVAPICILGWLSLARPVIDIILW